MAKKDWKAPFLKLKDQLGPLYDANDNVPVHFRTALLWRQATERCVRVASWVFLPAGANCWFAGRRGLGFFEGRQFRLEKRTTFDNPFFDFRE